jgi:hypothetical protein
MAQENFNVSQPNDGLGDKLRSAFIKVQSNFTDLFTDKVDKEVGKGLSANDYTTTEKNKLSNIENFAELNVQADFLQNDNTQDDFIKNKPAIPVLDDYLLNGGYFGTAQDLEDAIDSAGQLVKVTENGKTGYRLKDADPANYGDIGLDAVDLSFQIEENTTKGATGNNSHAQGADTTASGFASHSEGELTTASGQMAHAEGGGTTASGDKSHAEGANTTASAATSHAQGNGTTASGRASHAQGHQTLARSFAEHSGGTFGTDYTPQSATVFDPTDRLVNYGNGTGSFDRSDAYTLFKNGMQKFFTAALNTITNAVKGCVMLDDDARLNIHDGTAFKPIPFTTEVATAAQGVLANNALPATATAADSAKLGGQLPAFYAALNGAAFTGSLEKTVVSGFSTISTLSGSIFNSLVADSAANSTGINFLDTAPFRFSTSTNKLGAGFSEKMRIQNGNLGINQTNPTERLDVVGNGKFSGTVTAGNGTLLAGTGTTNFLPKFTASGTVGNSSIFDNGNVGIGTSSISSWATGFKAIQMTSGSSISSHPTVPLTYIGANYLLTNAGLKYIQTGGAARFIVNGFQSGFQWDIAPSGTAGSELIFATAMLINQNGFVGINKPTPTERLDVVGNGKFSGTVSCGQFTTATEPAYVKGAQFFNTTLNKMRIGGATAYETVTSS